MDYVLRKLDSCTHDVLNEDKLDRAFQQFVCAINGLLFTASDIQEKGQGIETGTPTFSSLLPIRFLSYPLKHSEEIWRALEFLPPEQLSVSESPAMSPDLIAEGGIYGVNLASAGMIIVPLTLVGAAVGYYLLRICGIFSKSEDNANVVERRPSVEHIQALVESEVHPTQPDETKLGSFKEVDMLSEIEKFASDFVKERGDVTTQDMHSSEAVAHTDKEEVLVTATTGTVSSNLELVTEPSIPTSENRDTKSAFVSLDAGLAFGEVTGAVFEREPGAEHLNLKTTQECELQVDSGMAESMHDNESEMQNSATSVSQVTEDDTQANPIVALEIQDQHCNSQDLPQDPITAGVQASEKTQSNTMDEILLSKTSSDAEKVPTCPRNDSHYFQLTDEGFSDAIVDIEYTHNDEESNNDIEVLLSGSYQEPVEVDIQQVDALNEDTTKDGKISIEDLKIDGEIIGQDVVKETGNDDGDINGSTGKTPEVDEKSKHGKTYKSCVTLKSSKLEVHVALTFENGESETDSEVTDRQGKMMTVTHDTSKHGGNYGGLFINSSEDMSGESNVSSVRKGNGFESNETEFFSEEYASSTSTPVVWNVDQTSSTNTGLDKHKRAVKDGAQSCHECSHKTENETRSEVKITAKTDLDGLQDQSEIQEDGTLESTGENELSALEEMPSVDRQDVGETVAKDRYGVADEITSTDGYESVVQISGLSDRDSSHKTADYRGNAPIGEMTKVVSGLKDLEDQPGIEENVALESTGNKELDVHEGMSTVDFHTVGETVAMDGYDVANEMTSPDGDESVVQISGQSDHECKHQAVDDTVPVLSGEATKVISGLDDLEDLSGIEENGTPGCIGDKELVVHEEMPKVHFHDVCENEPKDVHDVASKIMSKDEQESVVRSSEEYSHKTGIWIGEETIKPMDDLGVLREHSGMQENGTFESVRQNETAVHEEISKVDLQGVDESGPKDGYDVPNEITSRDEGAPVVQNDGQSDDECRYIMNGENENIRCLLKRGDSMLETLKDTIDSEYQTLSELERDHLYCHPMYTCTCYPESSGENKSCCHFQNILSQLTCDKTCDETKRIDTANVSKLSLNILGVPSHASAILSQQSIEGEGSSKSCIRKVFEHAKEVPDDVQKQKDEELRQFMSYHFDSIREDRVVDSEDAYNVEPLELPSFQATVSSQHSQQVLLDDKHEDRANEEGDLTSTRSPLNLVRNENECVTDQDHVETVEGGDDSKAVCNVDPHELQPNVQTSESKQDQLEILMNAEDEDVGHVLRLGRTANGGNGAAKTSVLGFEESENGNLSGLFQKSDTILEYLKNNADGKENVLVELKNDHVAQDAKFVCGCFTESTGENKTCCHFQDLMSQLMSEQAAMNEQQTNIANVSTLSVDILGVPNFSSAVLSQRLVDGENYGKTCIRKLFEQQGADRGYGVEDIQRKKYEELRNYMSFHFDNARSQKEDFDVGCDIGTKELLASFHGDTNPSVNQKIEDATEAHTPDNENCESVEH